MNSDRELTEKRFRELSERSARHGITTFTPFLTEAEQSRLLSISRTLAAPFSLFGGVPECERRIARFGEIPDTDTFSCWPIICMKIVPKSVRFSEELTHRDYLGALMHLGAERETLGDIFLVEGGAYVFALETAARLSEELLLTVRHTSVTVERCSPPESLLKPATFEATVRVTNERADAVIAHLYRLSREKAQQLFSDGLVFRNGEQILNDSTVLKEHDLISVRGIGRFRLIGSAGLSKKGKKMLLLECYGKR